MRDIVKIAWSRLKVIAAIVGDAQARGIATLFYFTILVPFALISRASSDPLRRQIASTSSYWDVRRPVENDMESAMRQG